MRNNIEIFIAKLLRVFYSLFPRLARLFVDNSFEYFCYGNIKKEEKKEIPKIIWTYWNSDELPLVISKSIDNWRFYNPEYTIHVLNDEGVRKFIKKIPSNIDSITPQRKSDWIRLELLNSYGGIWMDASIILTRSLDWVIDEQVKSNADFIGFYLDRFTVNKKYPVIESWFMASPKQSNFINLALHEFNFYVIENGPEYYLNHLKNKGIYESISQRIESPLYLSIHLAMQSVIQNKDVSTSVSLLNAEKTAFSFHELSKWNRSLLKISLLFKSVNLSDLPFLIKLRGPDRRRLDLYFKKGIYLKNSFLGEFLF